MATRVYSCSRRGRALKKDAAAAADARDVGDISSFCSSFPGPARDNNCYTSSEMAAVERRRDRRPRGDCVESLAFTAAGREQGQQQRRKRRKTLRQTLLLSIVTFVVCVLWQREAAAAFQAMLELPGGGKQCIGEQLSKHVLVVGEVHLLHPVPPPPSSGRKMNTPLLVTALDSSSATPVYKQQGKEHVRTAFTTTTAGTHSLCVQNLGADRMVVDIQILWGPEARDYGQIAKAEHLDEIMLQLMRLQDRLKLYQANVLYMRQNEQRMRDDSDNTASWLMTFCVVNVLLLILTALASAYYFKRFFRSKKII